MDTEEISRIREQFHGGLWPQFLQSVTLQSLRGWTGQTIHFPFPVTVVVGENGTGKSTVLKAAACAYENPGGTHSTFYPSDFFLRTHWDPIDNAVLRWTVRQGPNTREVEIRKGPQRWRGQKRPSRNVFWFDISRTLPLDASAGYARLAKMAAAEVSSQEINNEFRSRLSHVLGRHYTDARFVTSDADAHREVGLLARDGLEISQYHQGAGEDATLDLFRNLQAIPNNSLLIIDEVEASLHPKAQRRLVRVLLWLARQKRIQVILSSHSADVLRELPPESRIMLQRSQAGMSVVTGISPELALSRLDDDAHHELHVFVEDRQAALWLREILASAPDGSDLLQRIAILPVGAVDVVKTMGRLAAEEKLPYEAVAFVDGGEAISPGCVALPGALAPERQVYADLRGVGWTDLPARFGIGAGDLLAHLEDAMLDPDHHNWNSRVGDRIIKSKNSVWEILVTEWVRQCLSENDRDAVRDHIRDRLP